MSPNVDSPFKFGVPIVKAYIRRTNGILYPMLVICAISVIIFSGFSVATLLGWLPQPEANDLQHQGAFVWSATTLPGHGASPLASTAPGAAAPAR